MAVVLTQEKLKEVLDYNPRMGVMTWKVMMSPTAVAGSRAGTVIEKRKGSSCKYYRYVRLFGKKYKESRLIFLWVKGVFPTGDVDHKNGDSLDNRWKNLRPATRSQNMWNRAALKGSKTGLKGVSPSGKKFSAVIGVHNKNIRLGRFTTAEEAHAAYCEAAKKYHGEFARTA